ncbi:MAG: tail fiber domain-containing protein [Bacteroidales bacterium]|nr:tail fiber domain-containing protein [Bacteroidales bacterium]
MKTTKHLLKFAAVLFSMTIFAQTPQSFKYQTVVRDATGGAVQNQNVNLRFNIHDADASGLVVYSETHTVMTNQFGLVSLSIGGGMPVLGAFSSIDWGAGSKFLEVELDMGSGYTSIGTSQLLSVPYALYSESTANVDDADADPANELQTLFLAGNELSISDGNTVSLPSSGTGSRISDADGDTWVDVERNGDNDSIVFTTFGMERMVISHNGYVEVNGQMIATGFQGDGSGLTGVPGDGLGDHTATEDLDMNNYHIINLVSPTDANDAATKLYVDTQISLGGDNLGNHIATQNLELNGFRISNDGDNEGIFINNDGKVGIGTGTPSYALEVNGCLALDSSGATNRGVSLIEDVDEFGSTKGLTEHKIFGPYDGDKGYPGALYIASGRSADNSRNDIILYNLGCSPDVPGNPGTNNCNVPRIWLMGDTVFTNGKLGIGTDNPDYPLHVMGDINFTGDLYQDGVLFSGGGAGGGWTVSGNDVYSAVPGNVGIGTDTPDHKLQVQDGYVKFDVWDGSDSYAQFGSINGGYVQLYLHDGDTQSVAIRSNWHTYFDGGNVGIGTKEPGSTLEVAGHIWQSGTGGSTFLGYQAGESDDLSDNKNVAVGYQALQANTTGNDNCAIGFMSMPDNTTGENNIAYGFASLYENTEGSGNSAGGYRSLYANTTGNDNAAYGNRSLYSNTTGSSNIAIGLRSLYHNTDRSNLIAIGDSALFNNGLDASYSYHSTYNTAIGSKALFSNTTGSSNTAIGSHALFSNTTGLNNTAIGKSSLYRNMTGVSNTAFGNSSLQENTNGLCNTASGYSALNLNTTGNYNTAHGHSALKDNVTGDNNTAIGHQALYSNNSGNSNVAVGKKALYSSENRSNLVAIGDSALYNNGLGVTMWYHATNNTALGSKALYANTVGDENTASGYHALYANEDGYFNSAFGSFALDNNVSGICNAAFGSHVMTNNVSGSYNTALGYFSFTTANNYSNSAAIGYNAYITASNQVRLGNTSVASIGGYANWTNISDERFKRNIRQNVPGLQFIMKLEPVTYQLDVEKLDDFLGCGNRENSRGDDELIKKSARKKAAEIQTGFIAQDVERAANEIGFDFSGIDKPENENDHYGIRYAEFVMPLVKAVQELAAENQELKARIQTLEEKAVWK